MSNKLINAVIALVEDRPRDAREMLRSPEMKVSISEVQNRLTVSLRKREDAAAIEALKGVIRETLRINAEAETENYSDLEPHELYLMGVAQVEAIIDHAIDELES